MEEKIFIQKDKIKVGMQLGECIKDSMGRIMIENGVYLDDYQIRYIKEKMYPGIYTYRYVDDKASVGSTNESYFRPHGR